MSTLWNEADPKGDRGRGIASLLRLLRDTAVGYVFYQYLAEAPWRLQEGGIAWQLVNKVLDAKSFG